MTNFQVLKKSGLINSHLSSCYGRILINVVDTLNCLCYIVANYNFCCFMFFRTVKGSNADYLYLVEGYREGNKVKQRTIARFGKVDELCPEQLKEMAMKLLSLCPNNQLVDLEHTDELSRKNWGAPQVMNVLWDQFKLTSFFQRLFAERSVKYDIEAVIKLMLLDRLLSPCSKLKSFENQFLYDTNFSSVELHNFYRALDELSAQKGTIEKHLFEQSQLQSYVNLSAVFFDVTTFHFESVNQDEVRDFGYSKNAKFNEVQVILSLLVTEDGIPLGYELFPGNTFEGNTLNSSIKKLKSEYNINKVVVVADRGINNGSNLHSLVANGFEFIVGNRFKNLPKNLKQKILCQEDYIEVKKNPNDEDEFKYKIVPHEKVVHLEGKKEFISTNLICTYSSKRAEKDRSDRERLVSKAESIIKNGDGSKNRGAKKYLIEEKKNAAAVLNLKKIEEDARWDGYYVIETSDAQLSAEKVLEAYHQLWKIEESFRVYKSHLEARPLYHWTPARIEGHFVISYMAFLFERILEFNLKRLGQQNLSPTKIREALNTMQYSELKCGSKPYKLFSKVNTLGIRLLESLKITPPKQALPN